MGNFNDCCAAPDPNTDGLENKKTIERKPKTIMHFSDTLATEEEIDCKEEGRKTMLVKIDKKV